MRVCVGERLSGVRHRLPSSSQVYTFFRPGHSFLCCAHRGGASTRGDFASTSLSGPRRLDAAKRLRAFRIDCARIWGNKWDYAKTVYVDNHTEIAICCVKHGVFRLTPRDHLQRRAGCPKCEKRETMSKSESVTPALGQHLLVAREVAEQIASIAVPDGEKACVMEIGVGAGALTTALLARKGCRRVLGFEIDPQMIPRALGALSCWPLGVQADVIEMQKSLLDCAASDWGNELLRNSRPGSRCIILQGDALACNSWPGECSVAAANVPYRISAALVTRLLLHHPPLRRIVLTVQSEFARRLFARSGSLKYGRMAVLVELLCRHAGYALSTPLPPEAFDPPPKVESAVVLLEPRETLAIFDRPRPDVDLKLLDRLLRILFDGVRGEARGLNMGDALEAHGAATALASNWRTAVARAGVADRPAVAVEPADFVKVVEELQLLSDISGHGTSHASD